MQKCLRTIKSLTSSPRLQISELLLQSRQLEDENGMLSEKDARNIAVMEDLRQQLAELIKENDRRESVLADEKNEVSGVWRRAGGGGGRRPGVELVVASS